MKNMMIDYRAKDENEEIQIMRKVVDNYEFCIREGFAYFISEGTKTQVPLPDIVQVYTY